MKSLTGKIHPGFNKSAYVDFIELCEQLPMYNSWGSNFVKGVSLIEKTTCIQHAPEFEKTLETLFFPYSRNDKNSGIKNIIKAANILFEKLESSTIIINNPLDLILISKTPYHQMFNSVSGRSYNFDRNNEVSGIIITDGFICEIFLPTDCNLWISFFPHDNTFKFINSLQFCSTVMNNFNSCECFLISDAYAQKSIINALQVFLLRYNTTINLYEFRLDYSFDRKQKNILISLREKSTENILNFHRSTLSSQFKRSEDHSDSRLWMRIKGDFLFDDYLFCDITGTEPTIRKNPVIQQKHKSINIPEGLNIVFLNVCGMQSKKSADKIIDILTTLKFLKVKVAFLAEHNLKPKKLIELAQIFKSFGYKWWWNNPVCNNHERSVGALISCSITAINIPEIAFLNNDVCKSVGLIIKNENKENQDFAILATYRSPSLKTKKDNFPFF